ncbi:MAG: hypothetical protein LV479_04385 [Methylacidiphilales bacterium]|nr:hypothetical protein [Candidatus Methylacidiphilales bacterium]
MKGKEDKTYMGERGDVLAFIRWAEREGYLPRHNFDYSEVVSLKLSPGDRETCSPDDLAKLIVAAEHLRDQVCISLGAHAGIRHEEIEKFILRFVDFKNRVISMPPFYGEVRINKVPVGRKIPIQPVLYNRLKRLSDEGFPADQPVMRVADWGKRLRRIKKNACVRLPQNAFRHGYGSHRLQLTQSEGATALEMGTSREHLRDNYAIPQDEHVSLAWFAV